MYLDSERYELACSPPLPHTPLPPHPTSPESFIFNLECLSMYVLQVTYRT